jgi:hypothetical protein
VGDPAWGQVFYNMLFYKGGDEIKPRVNDIQQSLDEI